MYRLNWAGHLNGANREAFGAVITLDPRVLTPNLEVVIPRRKTKGEGALAGGTSGHAGFTQAAQALDQHR